MTTNAAVLWELDKPWSVEEIDLDGPKEGEVLVAFEATGLCHSDHHVQTDGKLLLDQTVTAEYKLNDMLAGRNIRGVIVHDH